MYIFVRSILLRGLDQQMTLKMDDYMTKIGIQFHHQTCPVHLECFEEGKPGKLRLSYQEMFLFGEVNESY